MSAPLHTRPISLTAQSISSTNPGLTVLSPSSSPSSRSSSNMGAPLLTPDFEADISSLSLKTTRIGYARSTSGISTDSSISSDQSVSGALTDPGAANENVSSTSKSNHRNVDMGITSPTRNFTSQSKNNVHFSLQGYTIGGRRVSETDAIPFPHSFLPQPSSSTQDVDPSSSTPSPPELQPGFSFGTCPSAPLKSTPTAELGPFEYPVSAPPESSSLAPTSTQYGITLGRRGSIALGQISRIAANASPFDPRPSFPHISSTTSPSGGSLAAFPNPPSSRRSSTCSSITTLPLSGRRPSILHSATTPSYPPVDLPPSPSSPTSAPAPTITSNPAQSPRPIRHGSIAFAHNPLPQPIPPSLLARRGSLPVAGLFTERRIPGSASSSSTVSSAQGSSHRPSLPIYHPGYTTTTAALYHRRDSQPDDESVGYTRRNSAGLGVKTGPTSGSLADHHAYAYPPPPSNYHNRNRFPSTSTRSAGSTRSSVISRTSIMSSPSSITPRSDISKDDYYHRSADHSAHTSAILAMSESSVNTHYDVESDEVREEEEGDDAHAEGKGDNEEEVYAKDIENQSLDGSSIISAAQTPLTPSVAVGFTDPWSNSKKILPTPATDSEETVAAKTTHFDNSRSVVSGFTFRPHRPSLETIPSDGTDSALRGSIDMADGIINAGSPDAGEKEK